jgi:23S rRNA pseudouridine2605 synthase
MGITKTPDTQVRLQKVIAASGLSSRRAAETLIREGKVTVNGEVVRMLGTCINPVTDHVKVDGTHIETAEPEVFVLLNKPPGCVTTMSDPLGRGTVANLLGRVRVRVFPVGRLDFDAEGLLLLTNNGMIAQACLHPRYHVPKTYVIKVSGVFSDEEIKMLKEGVALEDGVTSPADVKKAGKAKSNSWLEITIREGKKHQIKRMVEACGHRVMRIKRTRFGPLQLRGLAPGTFRYATDAEANALRAILHRSTTGETPRSQRPKPYLKNRVKPGETSSSKLPRKPLKKPFPRDAAKPRFTSTKRPAGAGRDGRQGLSKRPLSPRVATRKGQSVQRYDKPSGSSGSPSNFRGASATPQFTRESDRRSDFPKRSSNQGRDSGTSRKTQGNNTRSTFSKRPLRPRGTFEKAQTPKRSGRLSAFPKRSSKPRMSSAKVYTTKGASARSTFSKRGSAPIKKTPTKRRAPKR